MEKHRPKLSAPKLSAQIVEEASSWFIGFNDGEVDAAGREDFNAWLRRSPEHVRAYLQMSAFWEDAGALKKRPGLDIDGLIARARAEDNVHPLKLGVTSAETRLTPRRFSRALAATLLVAIGASLVVGYTLYRAPSYVTDIGEQRSLLLEDGSSVELNSRSRVKVKFTERERMVELLAGQALFRVAKDAGRPFIVNSGDTRVRAVGTQFDVYQKKSGTVVTVIEGRVAVSPSIPPIPSPPSAGERARVRGSPIFLSAGEQLSVSPQIAPTPKPANLAVATAWTEKKLVFQSTPLREVVEEFNRYNRQQLRIRDPELYDFHVSGVFPSTDSGRMVEFLRQRFGVTMSRSGDEIEISAARDIF